MPRRRGPPWQPRPARRRPLAAAPGPPSPARWPQLLTCPPRRPHPDSERSSRHLQLAPGTARRDPALVRQPPPPPRGPAPVRPLAAAAGRAPPIGLSSSGFCRELCADSTTTSRPASPGGPGLGLHFLPLTARALGPLQVLPPQPYRSRSSGPSAATRSRPLNPPDSELQGRFQLLPPEK